MRPRHSGLLIGGLLGLVFLYALPAAAWLFLDGGADRIRRGETVNGGPGGGIHKRDTLLFEMAVFGCGGLLAAPAVGAAAGRLCGSRVERSRRPRRRDEDGASRPGD